MRLNILGKKFGRLLVIKHTGKDKLGNIWECVCDCGNKKILHTATLTRNYGSVKSCGCLAKEHIGKLNRQIFGNSARRRLINTYKNRAKRSGFSFTLTEDQFFFLTTKPCHYCGIERRCNTNKISPHSYGHIDFNGLDRIDSSKGYSIDNVFTCCIDCNYAKHVKSYSEFKKYIKRLVEFNKDKL